MTVRAQQNTLRGLLTGPLQRPRQPARGERKALLRGIEMMELQCPDGAVVTADRAGAPRFGHQGALDPPTTAIDRVHSALPAAEAMVATSDEHRDAVNRAVGLDCVGPARARRRRLGEPYRPRRREPVAGEPMAHGRIAPIQALCHRADREALGQELFEHLTGDRAARGVPDGVRRDQAVLIDPVSDSGWCFAGLAGDRLDRASGLQS